MQSSNLIDIAALLAVVTRQAVISFRIPPVFFSRRNPTALAHPAAAGPAGEYDYATGGRGEGGISSLARFLRASPNLINSAVVFPPLSNLPLAKRVKHESVQNR